MPNRCSGFTLLEVAITLAVVAVLAAVVVPTFFGETRKAKASAEVQPMFSDMRTRLERYLQENGTYPTTVGESTWNPSGPPSTTKARLNLSMEGWRPLHLRLSGENAVYCRYTFATGTANESSSVGVQAAVFGFTAPWSEWYYLLAKCDMDGDPSALSWYFSSSSDMAIKKLDEGR